jgi:nitrogen PTS system EIIA component
MHLTLRQAARYLDVTETVLERWAERGELPASRVNDQYQFNRVDLLEWAAQRHLTVAPELLAEPGSHPDDLPGLAACVRDGGIHYGVPGADKERLLRRIVDAVPLPPEIDRPFLLEMLLGRERMGSTGLGNGIAIPHPREPIVLRVERPRVSICFPERPIDFEAIDSRPVHTLFVIIAPSVRTHLAVLAVIATALHDPGVVASLVARAPPDRLLRELERVEAAQARLRDARLARSDAS